jgi:hypothetical protein
MVVVAVGMITRSGDVLSELLERQPILVKPLLAWTEP